MAEEKKSAAKAAKGDGKATAKKAAGEAKTAPRKAAAKGDGKAAAKKSAGGAKAAPRKPAAKDADAPRRREEKAAPEPAAEEMRETLEEKAGEAPVERPQEEREEELSEEELRRLLEESLEQVTVADVVLTMMNQLASMGYMKMGLPESVNLKYRDLAQARLAIDTLEAMLRAAEGKVAAEMLQPFRGTLANLQLNYVQQQRR